MIPPRNAEQRTQMVGASKAAQLQALETEARVVRCDSDLALGGVLVRLKQDRLYTSAGYEPYSKYVDDHFHIYGVRRRQAERLLSGHRVLEILHDHGQHSLVRRIAESLLATL